MYMISAKEALETAKEELKRLDHLVYVSLKFTRAADVFKSIIQKSLLVFDHSFLSLLLELKNRNKSLQTSIPNLPGPRAELVSKIFSKNEFVSNNIYFYYLLRKLEKSEFRCSEEYRRHVTLVTRIENKDIEITIDILTDYYQRVKEFVNWVEKFINNEL